MSVSDLAAKKAAEARVESELKSPTPGITAPSGGISVEQALANAKALEARMIPGAPTRTPKARMLAAPEAVAKNPDKALRWGNMRDPEKMEAHKLDGYERITSEEGGKQIGNELVLLGIPKPLAEAREAEQKQRNRELMQAHTRTMEGAAESVARELRDKHGMNIDPSRILVNEG